MFIRHLAGGICATLVATTLLGAPADAVPDTDTAPSGSAATWLVGQLQDGLLQSSYGGAAYGPSADAAISLAAAGHTTEATTVARALADAVVGYTRPDEYGCPVDGDWSCDYADYVFKQTGYYAGSTAKAAVALQAAGLDPADAGADHVDLVGQLEDLVTESGRIQDDSYYGDYANTFGQAFAAQALIAAESPLAADVSDFLLDQQCDAGWFRLYFNGSDATCDDDATSEPSVDSTALAILALAPSVEAGTATNATARAVGRAESWLISAQDDQGGWTDGSADIGANTNSTGLAGRAMITTGHLAVARKAAVWVRSQQLQNVGDCAPYATADLGALAYDRAGWTDAQTTPVGSANDQFTQAAAQALPVLDVLPAAESTPAVAGPTGFVKANTAATYTVSGLAPGRPVCVSVGGRAALGSADVTGQATVTLRVPAGTGSATVTATDEVGSTATVQTKTLGQASLAVTTPARAKIGATVTVKITGLEAGEKAAVKLRKKQVAVGTANRNGVFTAKVTVTGPTGRAAVSAVGQFPNRGGSTTLTVLAK